ncbi:secreted Ly-6/uPAR-related protein 1-like isoform X2 [Lissotriton helveticus]
MKAVFGPLLAAALLVGTGDALKCYTCSLATSNSDCTVEQCSSYYDSYCQSIYASGSGTSYMTKSCASSCTAGTYTVLGVTTKTTCCSSDLCNGGVSSTNQCNGASSAKLSYTLLSLAAGISALMVRAVL